MPRHRARNGTRRRLTVALGSALAGVAVAAIGYVLLAGSDAAARLTAGADSRSPACAVATCQASVPPPSASELGTRKPSASESGEPPRPSRTQAPAFSPARSAPARPVATPSATRSAGSRADRAAASVLAAINAARSRARLPPYTLLAGLQASSRRHNMLMADGCGLSHQCPGEAALGARETAAGVHWTAAGENIGEGGPVSDTTAAISQMAVALTEDMLAEKPPDDGHRLNILSSTFTSVGIAVYRSSSGTVWVTQDFAN